MALGDYEQLKRARSAAWKRLRLRAWGSREHQEQEEDLEELRARSETYLRELLAKLPFRWHIAHAYTPNESASYGGADHIIVDEPIHIGRLKREPGDALSRPYAKFWGLTSVEDDRLPTALADIRIAERIVAGKASQRIMR
jgi:hypothetical protein